MDELLRLKEANKDLKSRLAKLSEASLLITRSLDPKDILQGVADGARLLTDARYGALLVFDDAGNIENLSISGLSDEEIEAVGVLPEGQGILGYLNELEGPLRLTNVGEHPRSCGVPENHPPLDTFLGMVISHLDRKVGTIYLCEKREGEFTEEDEEILAMFSSQAAVAISNALNYRSEQHSRANLEALVDLSPVGVMVFDAKTMNIIAINQEAQRISRYRYGLGTSLEEIRRIRVVRYMNGQAVPADDRPILRTLNSGEGMRAEEFMLDEDDGSGFPVLFSTTPIHSEDGDITSVILVVQDMRPREELERQRAEFLSMVSHELRTPLTTIKGSAATALSSMFPLNGAETRQFFRIIDEQADRMRDLINNLLDMTRIEAGMLSVSTEATEVAYILELARNTFLGGGARNVIEVDLPPGLPQVRADRQRVLQVLNNLLSNASKYSPDWSTISMAAWLEDVYVAISVTDQGQGLEPGQLERLFQKFSRIETEGAGQNPAGEGLGLSICRGIVEAHGGRIWAERAGPGWGMRFTFSIPVADEQERGGGQEAGGQRSGSAPAGQQRILAIDDDQQTLWYLRNALSEAGYSVAVASNPQEMESLLVSERPHLVMLDLMLPGTDGFELLRRIPAIRDVPVIFLSGNSAGENITRALEMGADDYIIKPFSPTELVARIRASLRKRAMSEAAEPGQPYRSGELTIDYAGRLVTVAGRPVRLTATEYKLLFELSVNAGRVLTRDQLLERVWGPEYLGDAQLLRAFVKSLRQKLGDPARNPAYIFTEPRVGYRMPPPSPG